VADFGSVPCLPDLPPRVAEFDVRTGALVQDLDLGFRANTCLTTADVPFVQWSPRGIVFGPDGALYVSVMQFEMMNGIPQANPNTLLGRILRFAHSGKGWEKASVFVDCDTSNCGGLARPEGLVFGPDGNLYVTSFRKSRNDNDKILVFDGKTGDYKGKIDLDQVGAAPDARAFAQAILFGPGGKLFVPITGNGPDTGSVRRYDVTLKTFDTFIHPGGALIAPWYLTFGSTDPATLAY
jgi:DNA-binding beta-propeller fold protein YncE